MQGLEFAILHWSSAAISFMDLDGVPGVFLTNLDLVGLTFVYLDLVEVYRVKVSLMPRGARRGIILMYLDGDLDGLVDLDLLGFNRGPARGTGQRCLP